MQRKRILFTILFIPLFFAVQGVSGQETAWYEINATFRKAMELYDKQEYGAAAELFRQVYNDASIAGKPPAEDGRNGMLRADARYYEIICGLETGNRQAENALLSFIADYPESEKTKSAYFQVGKLYFKRGEYKQVIEWFGEVKEGHLAGNDRAEYNFKLGYSYLETGERERALGLFRKAQTPRSPYTNEATYYYAHISFENRDFDTAMREFEKLSNVPRYRDAVVYYKAQILLSQNLTDQAIALAQPEFDKGQSTYDALLAKVLGSAYFNKEDYEKAVQYFNVFLNSEHAAEQSSQDSYQIGYSYYKTEDYENAIIVLEPLVNGKDAWTQHAMYILGDSFLKTGNKENARAAFERAAKLGHDEGVQEQALIQFAKLSYELGFSKFALSATQDFIQKFPNSPYIDEVRALRGEMLLTSRNYAEALRVMEEIRSQTNETNKLYQKVTYYRGAELFNEKQYEQALNLFKKAIYHSEDRTYTALANYWAGETNYELRYFDEAVQNYQAFFSNERARQTDIYQDANYSLGYAYYQTDNHKQSVRYFGEYIQSGPADGNRLTDARLRLADSYFVLRNYGQALDHYNQIIQRGGAGTDYALFQRGMIEGLRGQNSQKIATMQQIIQSYPRSAYAANAQLQIGNTYLTTGSTGQATDAYKKLVSHYPNSTRAAQGMMSIGLIHYNAGEDDKAIAAYKKVVSSYPSTEEAREAIQAIRNIYVEQGNAQAFIDYSKRVPQANISSSAQDSVSYEAARSQYRKGDCEKGLQAYNNYLDNYPEGLFAAEIHFYRAECLERTKQENKALDDYLYIAGQPRNRYTERALVRASAIQLARDSFQHALPLLKQLENNPEDKGNRSFALRGLMEAYHGTGQQDSVLYYSQQVMDNEIASADDINAASLYAGKAYLAQGDTDKALETLRKLGSAKTVEAAEAKFLIAQVQHDQGQYKASQATCFEVINNLPNYDYWVTRSFILLARNYARQDNIFQARSTLQSVIDNYQRDDDIIPLAKQTLQELNEGQAAEKQKEPAADTSSKPGTANQDSLDQKLLEEGLKEQ